MNLPEPNFDLNELLARQELVQTNFTLSALESVPLFDQEMRQIDQEMCQKVRDDLVQNCRTRIVQLLGEEMAHLLLQQGVLPEQLPSVDEQAEGEDIAQEFTNETIDGLFAVIFPSAPAPTVQPKAYLPLPDKGSAPSKSQREAGENSSAHEGQHERTAMTIDLLNGIGLAVSPHYFSQGTTSGEMLRSYSKIIVPELGVTILVCDQYENQTFIVPTTDLPVESVTKSQLKQLPGTEGICWSSNTQQWRDGMLSALQKVSRTRQLTQNDIANVARERVCCDENGIIIFGGTEYTYAKAFADRYDLRVETVHKHIKLQKLQKYVSGMLVYDPSGTIEVALYSMGGLVSLQLKPTRCCDPDGTVTHDGKVYIYPQEYARQKGILANKVLEKIAEHKFASWDCDGGYTFLSPKGKGNVTLYSLADLDAVEWPERPSQDQICDRNGRITIDGIVCTYVKVFAREKGVDDKVVVGKMEEQNIRSFDPGYEVFEPQGKQPVRLYRLDELETLSIQNRSERVKCNKDGTIELNGIVYSYVRRFSDNNGLNQADVLKAVGNKGLSEYDPGYIVYDADGKREVHLFPLEALKEIKQDLDRRKKYKKG